ncbi:hypothetical protein [Metabacillus litoralis]|uniref:hypothetical protein n=1 Tax=Metabacillus litoralis TaxID=152268 RepID=UPI00203AA340|nr:hypothetical protein [Metabacillus litoralis]
MKQKVAIMTPTGEKDKYGRPILQPIDSKARVQFSTRLIQGTDGQQHETSLEVDLPSGVSVQYGTEIEYKGTKGKVIAMNESTNLSGNKVFFRTVYVG